MILCGLQTHKFYLTVKLGTKTIADFHDISISVESEPGKGTKFSFVFFKNS